jgi:hypothetical protein
VMTCEEIEQHEKIEDPEKKALEQKVKIELLLERASQSNKDLNYAFDRVIRILEYALE